MFDIGWTEMLVIALVAIIVVGPKDLPRMLRTVGQTVGKMRRMAREFQDTFNDALKEAERQAELDTVRKQVEEVKQLDPLKNIKKSFDDSMKGTTEKHEDVASSSAEASPATEAANNISDEVSEGAKDEAVADVTESSPSEDAKPASDKTSGNSTSVEADSADKPEMPVLSPKADVVASDEHVKEDVKS